MLCKCPSTFAMVFKVMAYRAWLYPLRASLSLKNCLISQRSKVLSQGTLVRMVQYYPADFVPPQNIFSASKYPKR